jgi:hypothetical protein
MDYTVLQKEDFFRPNQKTLGKPRIFDAEAGGVEEKRKQHPFLRDAVFGPILSDVPLPDKYS